MVDQSQLIAQADRDRTALQFVALLGGLAGTDQSMAGADGAAVNYPNQYQTITPYGTAIEGRPVSNMQGGGGIKLSPMLLLLLGVVALAVLK